MPNASHVTEVILSLPLTQQPVCHSLKQKCWTNQLNCKKSRNYAILSYYVWHFVHFFFSKVLCNRNDQPLKLLCLNPYPIWSHLWDQRAYMPIKYPWHSRPCSISINFSSFLFSDCPRNGAGTIWNPLIFSHLQFSEHLNCLQ